LVKVFACVKMERVTFNMVAGDRKQGRVRKDGD
jgi:hypothetical protein